MSDKAKYIIKKTVKGYFYDTKVIDEIDINKASNQDEYENLAEELTDRLGKQDDFDFDIDFGDFDFESEKTELWLLDENDNEIEQIDLPYWID